MLEPTISTDESFEQELRGVEIAVQEYLQQQPTLEYQQFPQQQFPQQQFSQQQYTYQKIYSQPNLPQIQTYQLEDTQFCQYQQEGDQSNQGEQGDQEYIDQEDQEAEGDQQTSENDDPDGNHQDSGSKSCSGGNECEPGATAKHKRWHVYNMMQRVPAFINRRINYPHNKWISTRELARKIDQIDQFTHYNNMEEQVRASQFILLDVRSKKEYRTSHIHGAIHMPIAAHLCIVVRPTIKHVQNHFWNPTKHSPLRKAKGKRIFDILQRVDKNIEIVVYCAVGYRSGWITRALSAQGFNNASTLYGGVYKWANEGREIYRFKGDDNNPKYVGKKDSMKQKLRKKFKTPKKKPQQELDSANEKSQLKKDKDAVNAQGTRQEEEAHKIAPHQFVAEHMLAPKLKPNKSEAS